MSFSLSGTTITQTGTDTNLSGLTGISGVTTTNRNSHTEYFLNNRDLVVNGTLTIAADGTKEQLRFHDSVYSTNSIVVNGTLNVGTDNESNPLDYNYQDYIPAIQEDIGTVGYGVRNNQFGEGQNTTNRGSLYINGGNFNIYGRIVNVASWGTEPSSGSSVRIRHGLMTKHSGASYPYESDVIITNSTINSFALVSTSGGYTEISGTKIIGHVFVISNDTPLNSVFTINGIPDTNGQRLVTAGRSSGVNASNSPKAEAINLETGTDQLYGIISGRYWRVELKSEVKITVKDLDGNAITDSKVYYVGASGTETTASVNGSGEHSFTFLMATRAGENGTINAYVFYTKNADTTDDLIDVRTIAYDKTIGLIPDVSLRGITETLVNSTIFNDANLTQTTKATVDAYTTIDNTKELYDRAKSYLYDNYDGEQAVLIGRSGDVSELGAYNLTINNSAGSAFALSGSTFTIKSADFSGGTSGTGTVTVASGTLISNGSFANDIVYSSGAGTTIANITATGAIDFTVAGSYTITNSTINEVTNSSGGAVTLNLDSLSSITTNTGPNITIVVPTTELTVTSSEAGSLIRFYTGGTQTLLDSATGTTLVYTYAGTPTIDYTVDKAGFLPQRGTVSTDGTDINVGVTLVEDPVYEASSGLTFGASAAVDLNNKEFTLTTESSIQNFYSFMIESWRDQAALRNISFPISTNGPNSFWFNEGYVWAADGSAQNALSDGYRYVDNSGVLVDLASNITSQGTIPTGAYVRWSVSAGVAPSFFINSQPGPINRGIPVYISYGGLDFRDYLKMKVRVNGYESARADVSGLYGTLEDQQYVIALEPQEILDFTLGDPGVTGLTITDNTGSPVSWNGKNYSITITDSNNNSAEDIHRWINYNLAQVATFQGKNTFCWPDMVYKVGSVYETARGVIDDGTSEALRGVRVIRGSDAHPDFSRFQADDGSYYTPPVTISVINTRLASGTRVQIYNATQATEIFNDVVGSSGLNESFLFGTGEAIESGDTIRYRATYQSGTNYNIPITGSAVATGGDIEFLDSQESWTAVENWGIDGSTVTEFIADGTNIDIDLDDPDGLTTKTRLAAWWAYYITTADGIRNFWGCYSIQASNVIRQDVSVLDVLIHNVGSTSVRFIDNDVRYYRSDNSLPYDTSGTSIFMDYTGVPDVVETGTSGLTTSESDKLLSLYSFNPDVDVVKSNVKYVNDEEILGRGIKGDQFRAVGDV